MTYQQPIHPFQTEQFSSSVNNLESATAAKIKFEYQEDMPTHPMSCPTGINQHLEDVKAMDMPFRARGPTSTYNSNLSRFEVPEEYPAYLFPRHSSLSSLYTITQSHELLDGHSSTSMESVPMIPTASSTSISSVGSISSVSSTSSSGSNSSISSPCSNSASSAASKARARRASFNPDISNRVFTCNLDDCGKLFKRSEHLKRHVRSVHTLEKPFVCPIDSCPKRFSRSDNLNQHIRIHRHDKEKGAKSFNFTPMNPVGVVQA
ncbi:hypothetical protein BGX31_005482 [Mortierella sp. GBA43]|nr:hypothetical protein BGX31_005482 [Mortierella sp. GBA43]